MLPRGGRIAFLIAVLVAFEIQTSLSQINRASFPEGFVFGTASSAFQSSGRERRGDLAMDLSLFRGREKERVVACNSRTYYSDELEQRLKQMLLLTQKTSCHAKRPQYEGAVKADGRGPSVWDAFSHTFGNPSFPAESTSWISRVEAALSISLKTSSEDGVISQVLVSKSLIFSFRELIKMEQGKSIRQELIITTNSSTLYLLKAKQQGSLGISLDVIWFEPATNTTNDTEAAQRAQDFQLGWFIEPLILGNYPITMRNRVGDRLPNFTEKDVALVKGSFDFVGINHYTTFYARSNDSLFGDLIGNVLNDSLADSGAITLPFGKNLKPIGDRFHWISVCLVRSLIHTNASLCFLAALLGLVFLTLHHHLSKTAGKFYMVVHSTSRDEKLNELHQAKVRKPSRHHN
ncbi:hypothetical protein POTOM_038326 [Populus tomentosa]|uniref:Uncharacterized protein n=1 Tax=Populus tomentosa TaxID=118781 RepID=A0A8X7YX68_POPTO|nr:hypothetical protein POTOM_038326 [Populus tomentosa]